MYPRPPVAQQGASGHNHIYEGRKEKTGNNFSVNICAFSTLYQERRGGDFDSWSRKRHLKDGLASVHLFRSDGAYILVWMGIGAAVRFSGSRKMVREGR